MREPLLRVEHLKKYFYPKGNVFNNRQNFIRAVDDISFRVFPQETFGFVGESGCGKSTMARAIMRLTKSNGGRVIFNGKDLFSLRAGEMRAERVNIQMVFQKPFESLNPRKKIGELVREPLDIHTNLSRAEKDKRVLELLEKVGIQREKIESYPHQFSGGQRQRIGIARAIILRPKLVICDEAVSALDVSIQSQILNLLMDLQREFGLTYIFISHNLSVVKHMSDRIGVMYLGKLVEVADKNTLYQNAQHPYTQALISAIPVPDPDYVRDAVEISDDFPNPLNPPKGCRFCTRCQAAKPICIEREPIMQDLGGGHYVACHLYSKAEGWDDVL